MKKIALILAAQVLTVSAMANTVFTKESNNGSVSPTYQTSTTCAINGAVVRILTTGGQIQFPRPLLKQTQFTSEVENSTIAESLAGDAARAAVANHPGPIGGGVTSYTVTIDGGEAYLSELSGNVVIKENNSSAAKKLLKFIDKNCK